jgi:hypothetical protein
MTSTIKVNNVQNQCGQNIINENSNTITIGASGDTIALASGASQTGFGRTGTVDWQTDSIKTATFTAANGEGYFANTSGGAFTMNLPAGSAGAIVSVVDYTNTFQTNNLTISPNGSEKIGGVAASVSLETEGQSVTFVYVDGTEGWKNIQDSTSNVTGNAFIQATGGTITTCGSCKIHTFTGPGTFCVSQVHPCAANNLVSYMVVAGGGGGGTGDGGGGGGGAGGFRELKSPVTSYTASPLDGYPSAPNRITVTATGFPITVGGGGTGAGGTIPDPQAGTPGSVSTFSTISSAGGGHGGASPTGCIPTYRPGSPGGSGGGGSTVCSSGGTGNTPPVTPAQGTNGGGGQCNTGGGGGGATVAGETSPGPALAGDGGTGAGTGINPSTCVGTPGPTGPLRYFAGGGGGNNETPGAAPVQGSGGAGGGADGDVPGQNGNSGTTNTGGGGGGIDSNPQHPTTDHNGGSGIVIIRYKYQ